MTREQIYRSCAEKIALSNYLLLESATGTGKTRVSIDLTNHIINSHWYATASTINILILVAKRVHRQTWKEEIEKWGGFHHPSAQINVRMECYESMHKCADKHYDILLADEVHHIGSELRLQLLSMMSFGYLIGLSATIPRKLKQYFRYKHHAEVVSCDITEAIEDNLLPEPTILLSPLILDDREETESWEFHKEAVGPVIHARYKDIGKYKYNSSIHAIVSMTPKQKSQEFDRLIDFFKRNNRDRAKLYMSGKRLEFYADVKLPIIKDILNHLDNERTITFCKSIDQTEQLGRNCIHSKNKKSSSIYDDFNAGKINHITAVNILNENANLVNCKYGIYANISSSDIIVPQRLGRLLRHKSPVVIIPYFVGTREEEIIRDKMLVNFNKDYIKTIHSIQEI